MKRAGINKTLRATVGVRVDSGTTRIPQARGSTTTILPKNLKPATPIVPRGMGVNNHSRTTTLKATKATTNVATQRRQNLLNLITMYSKTKDRAKEGEVEEVRATRTKVKTKDTTKDKETIRLETETNRKDNLTSKVNEIAIIHDELIDTVM